MKFSDLSEDRTVDKVGMDILQPLPKSSLVLLETDSYLFTTQYVRYALDYRIDTIVLHGRMLSFPEYKENLTHIFPVLQLPDLKNSTSIADFIDLNKDKFPIYSNTKYPIMDGYTWIPYGVLYKFSKAEDANNVDMMISQNNTVWNSYQDPYNGILKTYKHLMLSEMLNVYMNARLNYAITLQKIDRWDLSKIQIEKAIALGGDNLPDAYTLLGLVHLFNSECDAAIASFDTAQRLEFFAITDVNYYKAVTYNDCYHDKKKAEELFEMYKRDKEKELTPLNTL